MPFHPLMKIAAALQHLAAQATPEEAHAAADAVHTAISKGANLNDILQAMLTWLKNPTNIATLVSIIIALIPK